VVPALGPVPLQRLTAESLEAMYRRLRERGLSGRTCAYVHTVVRKALSDAVSRGRLSRNVADLAERPKAQTPEMRTWTAEELSRFLGGLRGDRLYAAWVLAATTGLRRGEVLGLRWRDVDLEAGRLSIRQTLISVRHQIRLSEPKTAKGRRSVSLDSTTMATLREHRKRQLEERLAWGPAYQDQDLVFSREDGSPIHPTRFSSWFDHHVQHLRSANDRATTAGSDRVVAGRQNGTSHMRDSDPGGGPADRPQVRVRARPTNVSARHTYARFWSDSF